MQAVIDAISRLWSLGAKVGRKLTPSLNAC